MEMNILKDSKEELEVEIDSLTMVEILKVYLNKDPSVTFAAWKREHPTKRPVLAIRTKGKTPRKALGDAVASISKDLENVEADFKKLK